MPTAKVERVSLLEAEENRGTVIRCVTQVRVTGLTASDYTVLSQALATSGVPTYNSTLAQFPNIVLTNRSARLVDKTTVDIDCVYEVDKNQSLTAPVGGLVTQEVRANLQQVNTNLDINGDTVTVEHTYPADDPDWPGETKKQGGEFQTVVSQRTMIVRGVVKTKYPWLITNKLIGKVNAFAWMGAPVHTWLCITAGWEIHDRSSNRYLMSFEFQHNEETWNPTVIFIDERTGKPPTNLVENKGYKTVRKLEGADFERIIGARLQGG